MEAIKIIYLILFLFFLLSFYVTTGKEPYSSDEIFVVKEEKGIFIKRKIIPFFSKEEEICNLFGPFPTAKNLRQQLHYIKDSFTRRAIEKIKTEALS
jgi:hypothetical protein